MYRTRGSSDHSLTAGLRRRAAQAALLACSVAPALSAAVGFDDVAARAQKLAASPWQAPAKAADPRLATLKYDGYREIRFQPARSVWRAEGRPFELQLFHAGWYHPNPVKLYEIVDGKEQPLPVAKDAFNYGKALNPPPKTSEVAGFRLHFPVRSNDYKDEVIAFAGGSYFRAVAPDTGYGLSARGLAIDTVGGKGEEFPFFESFWFERPAADAKTVTFHALLNSPRATGAYRFVVRPGGSTGAADTVVDVQARLFLRAGVATLGIAPLTSMFLSGENQPRTSDFRPEVHDSDGLQVATADGEWLWRPLLNPRGTYTTSFAMRGLRGFGLMQRDRSFASYEDTEARYERRPSAWIEPLGDWGAGRVELMQFHTVDEFTDNVVAYWVPAKAPAPGQALDLSWRIHWQGEAMQRPPGGWVVQSRAGHGAMPLKAGEQQYIVDFAGGPLAKLDDEAPVRAIVSGGNAEVTETNVYRHPVNGSWRMTVKWKRSEPAKAVELRAFLQLGAEALTETWTHALPPE